MRIRWCLLLICLFTSNLFCLEPEQFMQRARQGAGAEELAQLLDQGLRQQDELASSWQLLALWHRTVWGNTEQSEAAWKSFRRSFPDSRYRPYADWFLARHLAENARITDSSLLLFNIVDTQDKDLAQKAQGLLVQLLRYRLKPADEEALKARARRRSQLDWLNGLEGAVRLRHRFGVVLPLSGSDHVAGQAVRKGLQAAMEQLTGKGAERWLLEILDCESDPVLAQAQMRDLSLRVDALLTLGEAEYVAAAGFSSPVPVFFPGYAGRPLHAEELNLFQFNADPALLARAYARLCVDSLQLDHLITLAPATRAGKRWLESLQKEVGAADSLIEFGQAQWYFPGAQDMRRQLENLCLFENAFDSLGAALVFAQDEDLKVLVPQLAWADPAHLVVANAPLLAAKEIYELRSLNRQLLVIADWLPETQVPEWHRWAAELEAREGRQPSALESRSFETLRLAMLAARQAELKESSFKVALQRLAATSLFGGELRMKGQRSDALRLLWLENGRFRELDSSRLFDADDLEEN